MSILQNTVWYKESCFVLEKLKILIKLQKNEISNSIQSSPIRRDKYSQILQ
jgi:hypothetical protein